MPHPAETFPPRPVSVAVQSVLYETPFPALVRMLEALDNSVRIGKRDVMCERAVVVLGDASSGPLLGEEALADLRERFPHLDDIVYDFFDGNLGTSKGHNRLATLSDCELIVTANPDIVADARALWRMAAACFVDGVGMVEAKQLPIEHPKDYDKYTGATSWAATAFAMTPRQVFEELEGFDDQTFFMYCDDVDYSWRVRESGRMVVFLPSAVVFHDKRLTVKGKWQPTQAEYFFSAQAALLLAHKWSRDDVVDRVLEIYRNSDVADQQAAAAEFEERRAAGRLVPQRDEERQVAEFVDGYYAKHRFSL